MKKSSAFLIILAVLLVAVVLAFLFKDTGDENRLLVGEPAPSFRGITMQGQALQLKDLKGDYILLDFWGSWCAPCRREHPELVAFKQEIDNKPLKSGAQLQFVSVAIERDSAAWLEAIEKDKLDWPLHIMEKTSNLEEPTTPIAVTFQIRELPSRYLINAEGIIVGVNQSVEGLKRFFRNK